MGEPSSKALGQAISRSLDWVDTVSTCTGLDADVRWLRFVRASLPYSPIDV
jgi:hypothetical protein